MSYITVPLKPVSVPAPENRWRYRWWIAGVWAGYSAMVTAGVLLVLVLIRVFHGIPDVRGLILPFILVEATAVGVSWMFVQLHVREARAKRWRQVAYPAYAQRLAEVKGWSWIVQAAAIFDGQWRIICVCSGGDRSDVHLLSIPTANVTPVIGDSDRVTFSDIQIVAEKQPGYPDMIVIGGQVTLTYDLVRGGPPPLVTQLLEDS